MFLDPPLSNTGMSSNYCRENMSLLFHYTILHSPGEKLKVLETKENVLFFDWRGETLEVFVVRTAANLLAILLLAANLSAANLLANIC